MRSTDSGNTCDVATLLMHVTRDVIAASGSGGCRTRSLSALTILGVLLASGFTCPSVVRGLTVNVSGSTCPVTTEFVERCRCSSLPDIRCRGGLKVLPTFSQDGVLYSSLYVDKQKIEAVPDNAFAGLRVTNVVLNFNPLDAERGLSSKSLGGLDDTLEQLQLGACGIQVLPDGLLASTRELRYLHLWANKISQIPAGFFKGAKKLEELTLWGNNFERLDENTLAGLWNLRRLDLDKNRITSLDKLAFRHLLELKVLHLGENNIQAIHGETFMFMNNLRVLNLNDNGIRSLYSKAFDGIDGLTSLSLSNNLINYVPGDVFEKLKNLSVLELHNNSIEIVWATTFAGLHSLRRLYLSGNKIGNLPEGVFRQLAKLEELFLESNRLHTLRRCALYKKTRLKTLSLYGNPIHCDCHLSNWILEMHRLNERMVIWGSCAFHHSTANETGMSRDHERFRAGGGIQNLVQTPESCEHTPIHNDCHLFS